jgi:L-ascorbate metabolism protein UlaG (beta-lactamase superfamily)
MQMTWLGHSAVHLATSGQSILIDPFFTGNPKHPEGFEDKLERLDVVVVTHGHEDHLGDSARLAKKYDATLVAQYEICMWLNGQGSRGPADEHRRRDRGRRHPLRHGPGLPQRRRHP